MSDLQTTARLTTTILVLSLGNAGCEDRGDTFDTGLRSVVGDSAGITIVENARPAPDSRLPWVLGAQPSLSIGSVGGGGADELFEVKDATRLGDGRIVIANSGSGELRVFNAAGSHAGTWGRRGEGPGEFAVRGPTTVAPWPGDSIAASDNVVRPRLSLFDMNGNHGHDVTLDATRGNILDLLPNGRIVSEGSVVFNRMAVFETRDLVRLETEWSVLDVDGTLHASLGRFPSGEAYFSEAWGGDMQHPFQRRAEGAVWGNLVAIGVSDSYEIKAFGADGSLVRIVRRDWDPRTPMQAESDRRAPWGVPPVDAYPVFDDILADRAGYLWVREYRMSDEEAEVWTVFDSEGRVLGLVETPAGLNVFEIGEDYVLGSAEDELGVEYVQLWGLLSGRAVDGARRSPADYHWSERDMNVRNRMRPVHPGEILRQELDELGLSANALSKSLGVPVNRVTMILNGQRGVSADTALRLARYFGTTPQLWLNLQKTWELRRAEIEAGREIAERVTPRRAVV